MDSFALGELVIVVAASVLIICLSHKMRLPAAYQTTSRTSAGS